MVFFRRTVLLTALTLISIIYLYCRHSELPQPDLTPNPSNSISSPAVNTHNPAHIVSPSLAAAPSRSAKKEQEQKLADIRKLPLKEQLAYHFPYDVHSKFPKFIWQTWKYTPSSGLFEEKFRESEASWTEHHPGFIHEVVTDAVAKHLIRYLYESIPEVLEAYNAMPLPVLKADFFRYLILLARGGIYSDIDTMALKPATEWIGSAFKPSHLGLVIGIEADPDRPDWKDWYSRRIQFCQWTIQSKRGHPILRNIVSKITKETLTRKRKGTLSHKHDDVVEWTGPAAWTDSAFDYFNDPDYFDMDNSLGDITPMNFTGMKEPIQAGDVVVLPITAFSPGIGHSGAGEPDDPMACVQHNFEGTWKPESERIKDVKED